MDADGDKVIDKWVCEFVLRRQQNPRVCGKRLLSTLRLEEDDGCTTLKKSAVLRDIWNRLIQGIVDERILDLLELFEKLQLHEGSAILESLKSAYCWAAAECTVRYMLAVDAVEAFLYWEALQRIWDLRIGLLNERDSVLVTQELIDWGYNLKNAIDDSELYQRLRQINTRYFAISYLCEFVKEHWVLVGSPYLELEASRRFRHKGNDTNVERNPDDVRNGETSPRPNDAHQCPGHLEDDPIDNTNGQSVFNVGQQEHEQSDNKGKPSVAQELKEDLLEVEALINGLTRDGIDDDQTSEQHSTSVTPQRLQAGVRGQDYNKEPENVNERASDSEGTLSGTVRPHLPNIKSFSVSPLRKGRMPKPQSSADRRLRKGWTREEVQTLREGVKEYGKSWKAIKEAYPELFANRTPVDLKDKWRNLVA
ncbi:PREDICTED: uncharacterized protein LOC104814922 [Tarenaya hassleriana]|uniref:uncharacterized protein LOC104814922 n=1 Tax=Tarenaya hassleriana TaxID=28532 RepID=UPI00053C460E|nr:PREDICTED: uncharacterized protein LOC104814922 [Tarenaya hassleriana]